MKSLNSISTTDPTRGASAAWTRGRTALACGFLTLLVALAYFNALGNDFCFDDRPFIEKSEDIHDIHDVPGLFGIGTGKISYRPVRQASYAIDLHFWGLEPFGFHLTNIVLHGIVTLLVFAAVWRFFRDPKLGLVSAAIFALHPIHTESVTYISGRKDVLCTLFVLLAFLLMVRLRTGWRELGLVSRAGHVAGIALTSLLAWGSKEMALALLPIAILLHLMLQIRETNDGRPTWINRRDLLAVAHRNRYAIGLLLVALPFIVWAGFQFVRGTHATWHGGTPWNNFQTVARVHLLYLFRMVSPTKLIGDYHAHSFRITDSPFDLEAALGFLVIAGIVGGALLATRKAFALSVGIIWYFAALLPVSHIRPHHELVAERFLYLPSIGFCIALAAIFVHFLQSKWKRPAAVALIVLLAAYGARTHYRNRDWKNDLTFWAVTKEQAPRNARAHIYHAYNLFYGGKPSKAIAVMHDGLEIIPDYYDGHYNLAVMYERVTDYRNAIAHYQKELDVYHHESAYFNLGLLYSKLHKYAEAQTTFEKMLEHFKPTSDALYYLGQVCEAQSKTEEAKRWYRKCIARKGDFAAKAEKRLQAMVAKSQAAAG